MQNLYDLTRKLNQSIDAAILRENRTSEEKILSDYYLPLYGGSQLYLQWEKDENRAIQQEESFYILAGKRLVDIVLATAAIIFVLSWLLPLISIFIFLDSKGPVFFIQARTGLQGVAFPCIKFRTMYNLKQAEFKQTSHNDDRITRVGKFLRRTNLDELPQFFNVLFGSMSIVGPRPHAVQHDACHWASATYRSRYCIKPGITGLAQIRGLRGETDKLQKMDHRVRYDLFYANRQSFILDMLIFLWTIEKMVKGDENAW